jgi:hypothetical protein
MTGKTTRVFLAGVALGALWLRRTPLHAAVAAAATAVAAISVAATSAVALWQRPCWRS